MKDTFELILAAYTKIDAALQANAADDEASDFRRKEMDKLLLKARAAIQAAGNMAWAIGTMSPMTDVHNTTKAFDADDYRIDYSHVEF